MLAAALSRAFEHTLPALPHRLDAPLAETMGTLAYRLSPQARAAVRANLAVVAPQRSDRERLVRQAFVHQVRHYLEIFRIGRMSEEALAGSFTLEGWEHFARAYARGKGVILASAHYGSFSLCGQIFLARGYPVTIPLERESSELQRMLNRARRVRGLRTVPTDSALGIHRVLRQGGVLALIVDRAVTGVGVRVPFFGRETLLPSAHVALALRTGAALIPGFARREDGRLIGRIEPELGLERSGDHDADVREGVRRFALVMERYIREAPDQWSMFQRIWG
jgi:KDO2-lipid IV(A) lauroyltransferase